MKAHNTKPLLLKLISYSIFRVFWHLPAEVGKLKFKKSTTCIFWPQKFSFKLPIVLKTDFKRRDNALKRGIRLFSEIEVPVDDFGL